MSQPDSKPDPSLEITSGAYGYWRSLAEYAQSDDFQDALQGEFSAEADVWPQQLDRRKFVEVMGASLAMAGLQGCFRQPEEKIVPYVNQPDSTAGLNPLQYATTFISGGDPIGLLAKSLSSRPIKIEGNELHPSSLGATDAQAQASILQLYDPDRTQAVKRGGRISTWSDFLTAVNQQFQTLSGEGFEGICLLTEAIHSPTLAAQLAELKDQYPGVRWFEYDPQAPDAQRRAMRAVSGRELQPIYHFDQADVVLAVDADFLSSGPRHVRHARDFAQNRKVVTETEGEAVMSRLYAVESAYTVTGTQADHRLALTPAGIEQFVEAIAARLGVVGDQQQAVPLPEGVAQAWFDAMVEDLQQYRPRGGSALVVPGLWSTPRTIALAHLINQQLGSVGTAVTYVESLDGTLAEERGNLAELVEEMNAGNVQALIVVGGNPVYAAPADINFAEAFLQVPFRVHLSLYEDETSQLCHWHLPALHYLEAWSDAQAVDGTCSLVQPLIRQLYQGKSEHELLAVLLDSPERSPYEIVRGYWRGAWGEDDFETRWQQALHDGVIEGTTLEPVEVSFSGELSESLSPREQSDQATSERAISVVFRPDPSIVDGRFANNAWLQELPKPVTKLTWDNAALVSPATAERLGIVDEMVVTLLRDERSLEVPALIVPGHADGCVTLHLGYGRTRAGRVGNGQGVNANLLRTWESPWNLSGVEVRNSDRRARLARTQHHHLMEGRDLVVAGTLNQLNEHPEHPEFLPADHGEHPSLYPEYQYPDNKWGMAVDLSACTGCNACVIACQAENNVPVVGKEQVLMGREMHWLRIDHYYHGEPTTPSSHNQPVMCQHCEHAPCEVVCPVAATVHTEDGLNAMVYNRCVGTRYCSNNCPYKVRRFNYLQYNDRDIPVLKMLRNPEVTVRNRGVMEKCTYCVQRISDARIKAGREGRPIETGEVVTACQSACPSEAIVFGDLNHSDAKVTQLHEHPLNYSLLGELNTRPRTFYLAEVRNPNPRISQEL